jgi:hypothetical protein
LLSGDGLHLTTEGQQALAEGIGRVLGDAPGAADGDCLRSTFRNDSDGSIPDDPRGGDDGPDGDRRSSAPRVATTTVARSNEPEATTAAR